LTQDEQRTANEDLLDIFDPEGFGPEGEWKKLDGMCLSKDTGEYVLLLRTYLKEYSHFADTLMKFASLTRRGKFPIVAVPVSVSGMLFKD
jgi:hypothetical protein